MAKQAKKSLIDFNVSADVIRKKFDIVLEELGKLGYKGIEDLPIIFEIGLTDLSLFPNINLKEDAKCQDYLEKWAKGYADATNNLPSQRTASPKGSCSDPAIEKIVQIAKGISESEASQMADYHNLFMSAENIQGNLLEEYISRSVRPYGWIWCNGNVLRAIDFCSCDGKVLLQIKNKLNTENSSSSAIRSGTDIKKWYRLGTKTSAGQKIPDYKWAGLNEIINGHITTNVTSECNMNEESYLQFLTEIVSMNNSIISEK